MAAIAFELVLVIICILTHYEKYQLREEVIDSKKIKTAYHDFLYSFVFDVEQLQKLVANHNCQIILPKSLEGKVDLSGINVPIHVDEEG